MKSMLKKIFFKLLGERKKDYIRVILSGIFCISVVFFSTSVGSSLVYISTGRRATMTELVMEVEKKLFEMYKNVNLQEKPEELAKRGGAHYSDVACNVINGIYNDKNTIIAVNTKNNGTLKQFEDESAIEVSCYVGKNGPVPVETVTDLPIFAQGLVGQIKSFERLAAEAAYTGDYNTALLAMVTNPLIADDIGGRKLLNEMLVAHKEYLPQFKDVIEKIEKVERAEF